MISPVHAEAMRYRDHLLLYKRGGGHHRTPFCADRAISSGLRKILISTVISTHRTVRLEFPIPEGPTPSAPGVYTVKVSRYVAGTRWSRSRYDALPDAGGPHRSNASPTTHFTRCGRDHLLLYKRGHGHHRTPFCADGRYHPALEKF